ncbi:MAG: hypothetical protein AB7K24_32535 [Gemmataceae bacterium]
MRFWHICALLLMLTNLTGCMRTRYVATTDISYSTPGPCPTSYNESTHDERRWCGFFPFCPERRVFAHHEE